MDKRPSLGQRPTSFNPEAASFSPAANTERAVINYVPGPSVSPLQELGASDTLQGESPFRPAPAFRPMYETYHDPGGSQVSGAQSGQRQMTLDEIRDIMQVLNQAQTEAARLAAPAVASINTSVPYQPLGFISPQRRAPDFNAPQVEELSESLGLPSTTGEDNSPLRFPKFATSKGFAESNLDGKLIGQALDKPLTANTLAHYLNDQNDPGPSAMVPQGLHSSKASARPEPKKGKRALTETTQASAGFYKEPPRQIPTGPRANLASPPPRFAPTGPAAFGRARRFSELHGTKPPQQQRAHHHRAPARRSTRTRAPTWTKRADQGPEPSAADIYPDDAVYMAAPCTPPSAYAAYAPAQGPASWRLCTEVYPSTQDASGAFRKPAGPSSLSAATTASTARDAFDIFAGHYPPSAADLRASDAQVHALLEYVFAHGVDDVEVDMGLDEESLTPGQRDGSRYGLRFYGLGLGDPWVGADMREVGLKQ